MNLHSLLQSEGLDPEALPFESEPAPSGRFEFEPLPAGTRLRAPSDFDKVFADAGAAFDVDPVILKSIAFAESGFDPDIISGKKRSRAGAIGLMQFMPDTAKEYDNLDPTNPVQSIFAAAQYMRKSLDKFGGDYGKAVASYNHGPNRDTYNREDWDQRVPPETQKYLMTVFDAAGRFKDGQAERGLPQGVTPSKAGAGRGSVSPGMTNTQDVQAVAPKADTLDAKLAKQGEFSPLEESGKGLQSGYTGLKQMWEANKVLKDSVLANSMAQRLSAFDRIDAGATDVPRAIGLAYQQADSAGRAKIRADAQKELSNRQDFIGASMETIRQYQAEQQRTKGRTTDLTDVGNLKDFGNWLAFNGASGVVSMAPLMVAAVATGPAAPLVAGVIGYGMATGELAGDRIQNAQGKLSPQRFSRNPDRYDDAVRAENQNVTDYVAKTAGLTVGVAVPFAGLDVALGPVASLLKGAGKEAAWQGVKGATKEIAKDAGEEAVAGGSQEVMKILTENALGEQDGVLTGENLKRVINSAAAEAAGGMVGGAGRVGYQAATRPAPTVESQPTTPQPPPTVAPAAPVTPDTAKTQAVDNIAAAILEAEGGTTQAAPVQPGSQAADAGTAPVAQGTADSGGGLTSAGAVDVAGQSESAQSLTDAPSRLRRIEALNTERSAIARQLEAQGQSIGDDPLGKAIQAATSPLATRDADWLLEALTYSEQTNRTDIAQEVKLRLTELADKLEAESVTDSVTPGVATDNPKYETIAANLRARRESKGLTADAIRARLKSQQAGAPSQPGNFSATPTATVGTQTNVQAGPGFTATGIAAEMAALKARSQPQAQPAQQTAAPAPAKKPRTKPQPLLTDGERDMLADFERMYQADVKGEIKTRLGLLPARQDEATAPAEKRKPSELLAAIKRAGGIKSTNAGDLMGGSAMDANRILPGLFTKGGMNLDLLVPFLKERGYLTQADEDSIKDNGGVNKLAEILQVELSGDRAQTVDSTAGYEADAGNAIRSELDSKAFALGLPMKVTNEMSTERLNGVINRIERKLGKPVNTDFATRKMSRTEAMAERQAILMADRVERARAQYDADIQAFAEANDRVQERVLDVMTDEDGNIEVIYESTVGEAYDNRNVQEDSGQAGAPVTQGARTGSGNPEANRTEAGADEETLTTYTPAEVTARQAATAQAEAATKRAEDAAARAEAAAKQASEIAQRSVAAADTFELGGNAEDNLSGQQGLRFSKSTESPRTQASTIRTAITKAYGNLLPRLEGKGLVSLTQTEEDAIAAAAQARADKNGGDVEAIKNQLRGSVLASVAPQTESENFKRWFGDSQVVDSDGKPLVVYHGTDADFTEFKTRKQGSNTGAKDARMGFWFSSDAEHAGNFNASNVANRILPVYLGLKNPLVVDHSTLDASVAHPRGEKYESSLRTDAISKAKKAGHDGVIFKNTFDSYAARSDMSGAYRVDLYVAFHPEQIKSSIGNSGAFDPTNLDIRRSADGNLEGFFDPATGKSFLIADNLTAESAPATLMHEVGIHRAAEGGGKMGAVIERAGGILRIERNNEFVQRVQSRMDESGETSNEEAAAYIVTEYEKDRTNAPASVGKWVKDFIADVRAWLFSKGVLLKADQLTVADIAAVARANASRIAKGKGWVGSAQKDGAFRFGNTDGQRSKDIATVADAFSGEGIQLEGFSNFGGVQVGVRLKDAPTYTMEFKSQDGAGPLTIDATQANGETGQSPGGNAGQRMYQTLFAWAHNNGRQVDADYSLSYVNELRRTSAMLSSALRFGTIDHFGELNEQQGVDGWDATDFSASVKALAEAELRKVEQRVPISSSLEIDPVTGRVYTRDSAVLERLRDGVDSEASVDGRPGADQQGASRTRNLAESEIRLAAGEVNPRPVDGVSQTAANAQTRNTDTVGNGTGVQGESLSDSELARYLASTRGGFEAHGVGVSTLKRALITRDFAGETDLPGLLYSVAGDTDIRRSVRNSGQGQLFPQQAVTTWDDMGDSKVDSLIYKGQDDRIDLKRVQENIAKAGRQVREEFDARMAETLFPGRVAKRNESFVDHEVKPLLQAMSASNVSMEELGDYLLARHAPERNAQIAKVNPGMPDGGAGTNSQGVLMTTQAAQDHIANLSAGKRTALQLLARQVDAITKGTREMLVTEGLEKASTVAAWEGAYQNYVPLFKDEAAETPGHPVGSGFSVKGGASKRAMGSTKEVTNVLAHVLMQREAAITRAEKNRVAMSLYGLALSNPNKEFWGTVVPNMSTPEILAELQNMGVNVADAFAGMEATPTIRYVDPNTGLVTERPNPVYKNLDNALVVKVDGEDRVILFNKNNARAMRLAESLKNQNRGSGVFVEGTNLVAPVTRFMASMLTQYNPAFGMVNAVRDIQGALVNLSSTPLKGKQAKVLADVPAALKGIARDVSGNANRTQWSDLWVQFQEDGGRTGIRDLVSDPYEKAGQIEKDLKRLSSTGKLTPGNAAHAVLDLLSGFNDTLENGVRVAAYKAALDSGMSRPAAAKLARELTVDFNRKGRTGRELGKLYAFLNASVQGSARTIQTLKGPMGAKIMAGGFAIGVLQAFMLAAAGFDDDDIPEFIKSRNLIIPMGGDRYVTIPMALGLHVLPNTGRAVTELVMSGGKDIGTKSLNTLVEIVTSFNPFGGGGDWKSAHGPLTMVAPTVMDPGIDMAMNRDFTGRQISKERRNPGDVRPGATMAREGTKKSPIGQVYISLSELINKVTLGTDVTKGAWSPTPEELRYMATVLGGGVYRETERAVNAAVLLARGEEVKPHQVPLGSRFAGTLDEEMSTMSRYYKNDEALNKFWSEFRAEAKDGNTERVAEMRKDPRYTAAAMNSKIEQNISKLNKLASENVGDKAKYEELNQRRAELMRKVNEAVKEAESK